jgi:hypothetical protein
VRRMDEVGQGLRVGLVDEVSVASCWLITKRIRIDTPVR